MSRWCNAFPGTVRITNDLGKFKNSDAALAAFDTVRATFAELPADQVHGSLRSQGWGKDTRWWSEIHFADANAATAFQKKHGGELWNCVAIYDRNDADQLVKSWIAEQKQNSPDYAVQVEVIDNQGAERQRIFSRSKAPATPSAYVFFSDADAAMLFKLTLGGQVSSH